MSASISPGLASYHTARNEPNTHSASMTATSVNNYFFCVEPHHVDLIPCNLLGDFSKEMPPPIPNTLLNQQIQHIPALYETVENWKKAPLPLRINSYLQDKKQTNVPTSRPNGFTYFASGIYPLPSPEMYLLYDHRLEYCALTTRKWLVQESIALDRFSTSIQARLKAAYMLLPYCIKSRHIQWVTEDFYLQWKHSPPQDELQSATTPAQHMHLVEKRRDASRVMQYKTLLQKREDLRHALFYAQIKLTLVSLLFFFAARCQLKISFHAPH